MKIPLPDDAWAQLRDPRKVPERLRRPVARLGMELEQTVDMKALRKCKTDEDAGRLLGTEGLRITTDLNDAGVVALVAQWSFEAPINLETLQDLPGDAYDALRKECSPLIGMMHVDAEPSPDPASPSEPSQP